MKSKIPNWLNDRFQKIYDNAKVEHPEYGYRDIVNHVFPDVSEFIEILKEWYDNDDILDSFDNDELIDKVRYTYDWDNAIEDEVNEKVEDEIDSRRLVDEWKYEALKDEIEELRKKKSYKDMTPDELWEHVCCLLDIVPYGDIENELVEMNDKLMKSSYAKR